MFTCSDRERFSNRELTHAHHRKPGEEYSKIIKPEGELVTEEVGAPLNARRKGSATSRVSRWPVHDVNEAS
jgi:hypothetical protein